jgi:hypothetical protein
VKPSQLIQALNSLLGQRLSCFIWGATGVGKSNIVGQIAAMRKEQLCDIRAVLLDSVDLRGLPRIKGDKTIWVPPAFLPREGTGILFLDELPSAPQMVQAACYQLVLDRKLGEYTLPDGWSVIAAGNPAGEKGVHFAMPRPLRNRFIHLSLEPDLDEWCLWGLQKVRHDIVAFLRFRRELFFQPGQPADNAWTSPRTWEMASNALDGLIASGASKEVVFAVLSGTIGEGTAGEFTAFMDMLNTLPSIDAILLNPLSAPVPTGPSQRIAVSTGLGRVITPQSIGKALAYLKRLPAEFMVLAMRDASARDSTITHTPEFTGFATEFAYAFN